jgi:hypothetical protein
LQDDFSVFSGMVYLSGALTHFLSRIFAKPAPTIIVYIQRKAAVFRSQNHCVYTPSDNPHELRYGGWHSHILPDKQARITAAHNFLDGQDKAEQEQQQITEKS